jgi:hypothetical protein
VHDAIQAIEKRYKPYFSTPPATGSESKEVAAAAAAYRVLSNDGICPESTQPTLDAAFKPYSLSPDQAALTIGYAAADALLATEIRPAPMMTHKPGVGIGQWAPTPPAELPMAFVYLASTRPFVMPKASAFRPGPPPPVNSNAYTKDYKEVQERGDALKHPQNAACPAPADTDMARFWAGNFGAQWNQAMRDIAVDRQLGVGDTARLLALGNLAASDAAIAIWDSKTFYNFWRPITAIRAPDDGNPRTTSDPNWTPFISSAHFPAGSQNPPYPDYVSGANGITGAFTTILQLFFKTDNLPFEVYKATPALAICTNPRLYRRISQAAEEVVEARIVLGIHFRFADTAARTLGTRVAVNTYARALRPVKE